MDSNHAETTKQSNVKSLVKEKKESLPFASIELLKRCGNKMKRFSTESSNELSSHVSGNTSGQVLSTKEIIKLAREKYLQYISQTPNVLSTCFFIPLKLVNLVSLVRLLKMWSLYYFF